MRCFGGRKSNTVDRGDEDELRRTGRRASHHAQNRGERFATFMTESRVERTGRYTFGDAVVKVNPVRYMPGKRDGAVCVGRWVCSTWMLSTGPAEAPALRFVAGRVEERTLSSTKRLGKRGDKSRAADSEAHSALLYKATGYYILAQASKTVGMLPLLPGILMVCLGLADGLSLNTILHKDLVPLNGLNKNYRKGYAEARVERAGRYAFGDAVTGVNTMRATRYPAVSRCDIGWGKRDGAIGVSSEWVHTGLRARRRGKHIVRTAEFGRRGGRLGVEIGAGGGERHQWRMHEKESSSKPGGGMKMWEERRRIKGGGMRNEDAPLYAMLDTDPARDDACRTLPMWVYCATERLGGISPLETKEVTEENSGILPRPTENFKRLGLDKTETAAGAALCPAVPRANNGIYTREDERCE
ncbi:hypothetical protein B0H11DRAFT_1898644 [Mycena galericulata]|nr:hypothetical protein B0H11DRAFT_1898644 [Mycena galericulata]